MYVCIGTAIVVIYKSDTIQNKFYNYVTALLKGSQITGRVALVFKINVVHLPN